MTHYPHIYLVKNSALSILLTIVLLSLASCGSSDSEGSMDPLRFDPSSTDLQVTLVEDVIDNSNSNTLSSRSAHTPSVNNDQAVIDALLPYAADTFNTFYISRTVIDEDGNITLTLIGDTDNENFNDSTPPNISLGNGSVTQAVTNDGTGDVDFKGILDDPDDLNGDKITLSNIRLESSVPDAFPFADTDGRKKLSRYDNLYIKSRAGYPPSANIEGNDLTWGQLLAGEYGFVTYTSVSYVGADSPDDGDELPDERVRIEVAVFDYQYDQEVSADNALLDGGAWAFGFKGVTSTPSADTSGTLSYRGPILGIQNLTGSRVDVQDDDNIIFTTANNPELEININFDQQDDPFTFQMANAILQPVNISSEENRVEGSVTVTIEGDGTVGEDTLEGITSSDAKLTGRITGINLSFTTPITKGGTTLIATQNVDIDDLDLEDGTGGPIGQALHGFFYGDGAETEDTTAALAGFFSFEASFGPHNSSRYRSSIPLQSGTGESQNWRFDHDMIGMFLAEKY